MKYFKVQLRLLLVSFIIVERIFAVSLNISGYVQDSKTGSPLPGANIFIVGTSIGTAATENGQYKIPDLKEGKYLIRVDYIGYVTAEDSINVTGDGDINIDFSLNYTTIEGQEVTVTAQAKGQMDAINSQLNAHSIVNILSSDRIQELPDANAAESVARMPGVTIKREGGEGNKVVIRGLSPKYNAITVDGTRLASTDPDDRSTDLSMISQYMLDGIEVTKAGTPNLDADVLGGTVNFKLKKAKSGIHANVITQGIYNGLKESSDDYKYVVSISNRFWKDRIGILGQTDIEKRNRGSHELGAAYTNPRATLDSITTLRLMSLNLYDINRINNRKNTLIVMDVKMPNGGGLSYSNLSSAINKDITRHSSNYSVGGNTGRNYSSAINDNSINISTETIKYQQTLFSKMRFDVFKSFTQSQNTYKDYTFYFTEPFAYTEQTSDISITKVLQIAKNDTGAIGFERYAYNQNKSKESESTFGFNLEYDFRVSKLLSGKITIGNKFRSKKREFDRNNEYANVAAPAGLTIPRDSLIMTFPRIAKYAPLGTRVMPYWAFIDDNYESGNFLNGQYPMSPVADLDFMMDVYSYFAKRWNRYTTGSTNNENIMHQLHETNSIMYDYSGKENYIAQYFMVELDIGQKINIISGARIEINETNYTSYRSRRSALPHWIFTGEPYSHDRENSYYLPALFLRYKPYSWLNIRFASTNTLTRPNYTNIIPFREITATTVDYRNPDLKPGVSKNIDISVSLNQNHLGFLNLSYFEKNITGLIFSSGGRHIADPNDYDLPENLINYRIDDYISNNLNPVTLSGVEVDYQARFWYLPSILSGLVLNTNYTITNSQVKYPRTIIESEFNWDVIPPQVVTTNNDTLYVDRLIDQPNEILNISLGYDYKGFSGRLSMLLKSDVFITTNFWPELRETTDDYKRWDFSMKQKLPVNGLEIFLNMNNITEAVDVNRFRGNNDLSLEQHYGKTIDLGFRYSF